MILDLYTARVDAMELKRSSNDKWGTDSGQYSRILSSRNFDQIRLIAQEYEYITGHSLEVDMKKEFTGEVLDALLSILRFALDSSEFFARCFHKAVMGKLDKALIRLIVTRSELDIEDIKEAYKKKYNNVLLKNDIKKKTKGNYQKALLKLIGE
jgi:Annexin